MIDKDYFKRWHAAHPGYQAERLRKKLENNPEERLKRNEYQCEYYKKNQEKLKKYNRKYQKMYREKKKGVELSKNSSDNG